jgi:outer membrane protein assembly factor BamB
MDRNLPRTDLILTFLLAFSPAVLGFAIQGSASTAAQNWPQWRGPEGNGVSRATGLPTSWGPDKNILWKAPMPSWSGGTPVVWGDRIFVTSASKAAEPASAAQAQSQDQPPPQPGQGPAGGRQGPGRGGYGGRRDAGGPALLIVCISKKDGSALWQKELDQGNRVYNKQNMSSPSPVTDGKLVWVMTGTGAVTAFDFGGKEIWKKNIQKEYGRFGLNWGYASSPILYNGKLIIQVLHGNNTTDPSYLVALDGASGRQIWRQERPTDARQESPDAYTTPALITAGGKTQVVVSGGDYVTAHDPESGKEIWRAGGLNPFKSANFRIVNSPVVADGMIYAGSRQKPVLALRAGGTGDVTTRGLAWKWDDRGGPDVPTPVCDGKYFYMSDDRGAVTCLDAKTGKLIWGPERTGTGTVDSSLLLADGKIYITNENAVTTVLQAGPEFKVLSTNELDGSYTLSSIAVSGKQLLLRTSNYLYCIGERPAK